MGQVIKILPITERFINEYNRLKKAGKLPPNVELAEIMDIKTPSTISNILVRKQNIKPEAWERFRSRFRISESESNGQFAAAGADQPPAFVPIPWQEYLQLIHLSLEALKAGQNEILLQQAKTRAEVRGYGKYQLVKDSKGRSETFERLLLEVDKLVNGELTQDDAQDNPPGS